MVWSFIFIKYPRWLQRDIWYTSRYIWWSFGPPTSGYACHKQYHFFFGKTGICVNTPLFRVFYCLSEKSDLFSFKLVKTRLLITRTFCLTYQQECYYPVIIYTYYIDTSNTYGWNHLFSNCSSLCKN